MLFLPPFRRLPWPVPARFVRGMVWFTCTRGWHKITPATRRRPDSASRGVSRACTAARSPLCVARHSLMLPLSAAPAVLHSRRMHTTGDTIGDPSQKKAPHPTKRAGTLAGLPRGCHDACLRVRGAPRASGACCALVRGAVASRVAWRSQSRTARMHHLGDLKDPARGSHARTRRASALPRRANHCAGASH